MGVPEGFSTALMNISYNDHSKFKGDDKSQNKNSGPDLNPVCEDLQPVVHDPPD
jgi:hypothetical protein